VTGTLKSVHLWQMNMKLTDRSKLHN